METNNDSLILDANNLANTSLIRMIMASLMANGLDVKGVHQTMQKYKHRVIPFDNNIPDILKTPFYHTRFILDHMSVKGGTAYGFFFNPEDMSIQQLLSLADEGFQFLNSGIENKLYSAEELIVFYEEVKTFIEIFNQDVEEKDSMYIAVLAILLGAKGQLK